MNKIAELAIVGDNDFVLGFQLIGIKKIFKSETRLGLKEKFNEALADKSIGIIVTNDKSLNRLDQNFRTTVENTIMPVLVVLSHGDAGQEKLRESIKKAIGIDLLSK